MSLAEWRRVQSVDLDGVFLSLREAARHLVARGEGGSLVAVSSTSAIHGAPGMEHYASAKAGVLAMIRSPRRRAGPPPHPLQLDPARAGPRPRCCRPSTSSPKFVDATTRRTPVRRWGEPDDLGPAAVFLADPTQTFHTGDLLVVDGGYTVF